MVPLCPCRLHVLGLWGRQVAGAALSHTLLVGSLGEGGKASLVLPKLEGKVLLLLGGRRRKEGA